MIFTEKQRQDFAEASRPLMKFINDNCHPHVVVIVTPCKAEISEGINSFVTEDYIKD